MRSGATTGWSGGISRRRFGQRIQGLHGEHRGKPYAGNPHVRFDEGLLARAFTRRAGVYSPRSLEMPAKSTLRLLYAAGLNSRKYPRIESVGGFWRNSHE